MARDPLATSRLGRLDAALREMFETLCAQAVPSRLLSLVEQLDDEPGADEAEPAKGRGGHTS